MFGKIFITQLHNCVMLVTPLIKSTIANTFQCIFLYCWPVHCPKQREPTLFIHKMKHLACARGLDIFSSLGILLFSRFQRLLSQTNFAQLHRSLLHLIIFSHLCCCSTLIFEDKLCFSFWLPFPQSRFSKGHFYSEMTNPCLISAWNFVHQASSFIGAISFQHVFHLHPTSHLKASNNSASFTFTIQISCVT